MKHSLLMLTLVFILTLVSNQTRAQVKTAPPVKESAERTSPKFADGYVEVLPVYKDGGMDGVFRFIKKNLRYPEGQVKSGKVFVNFVITETGDVRDAEIQRGLGEPFDAEALRVVRSLGKWNPAVQKGQPVAMRYTIPVSFTYSSAASK